MVNPQWNWKSPFCQTWRACRNRPC